MRGLLGLMWPDRAEHSNRSVRFLQQRFYRMSFNRNFVFLFNRVAKSGVTIYDNSNSWLLLITAVRLQVEQIQLLPISPKSLSQPYLEVPVK